MRDRAVGIVRVSQVAGRAGESFASPGEQRDRITAECERRGLKLAEVVEELDVSGGTPLARRAGLSHALGLIETGSAGVLVVAYFDRLVRSLRVQDEIVARVEAAGGRVLAVDIGQVSSATAGQWLSSTLLGAVNEYQRRTSAERSREAQARAVARGVVPFDRVPPGYRRGPDGRLVVQEREAEVVREAFHLRADEATIADIRSHLAAHGIVRSYHGTQALLASRIVLGEIHFGALVNLHAHEAIVDRGLWRRVQDVKVSRGRRAKSDRLLARLRVLRCGTCGRAMIAATQTQGGRRYPFYRCGAVRHDCPARASISAQLVEKVVEDAVRERLADREGQASLAEDARAADIEAEKAQADLDAAIRAFAGLDEETAAVERLAELRRVRDDAREHADRLRGGAAVEVITVSNDYATLSPPARRALIRAVVAQVVVAPGRGAGRARVEFVGE